MIIVDATGVEPQPWRNGGGQTRELLTWPENSDWKLRISQADIETDGPFSDFAQIWRWIAVIGGEGVVLTFSDRERILRYGDAPFGFDGGEAPGCRLLDGPVRDINLMARSGSSTMLQVTGGERWEGQFAWRGLYTAVPGLWNNGMQECVLAAHTLIWTDVANGSVWTFIPDDTGTACRAWWLGYRPHILFV